MLDWYALHSADIENVFQQVLYFNGFLLLSALMYVVYGIELWNIGLRRHGGIVRKDADVGQFPPGYFTMLAVQLLPLTVTGFVRHDVFVIATRLVTLVTVLLVYGISTSRDGTFDKPWYRLWLLFWLSVSVMGPMVYVESINLQHFVENNEKIIAYASVAAMILFVICGQRRRRCLRTSSAAITRSSGFPRKSCVSSGSPSRRSTMDTCSDGPIRSFCRVSSVRSVFSA
jgi:hypothetical protein